MSKKQAITLANLILNHNPAGDTDYDLRVPESGVATELHIRIRTQESVFKCMIDYDGIIHDKEETRNFAGW